MPNNPSITSVTHAVENTAVIILGKSTLPTVMGSSEAGRDAATRTATSLSARGYGNRSCCEEVLNATGSSDLQAFALLFGKHYVWLALLRIIPQQRPVGGPRPIRMSLVDRWYNG